VSAPRLSVVGQDALHGQLSGEALPAPREFLLPGRWSRAELPLQSR
jgi:hypothetical protein